MAYQYFRIREFLKLFAGVALVTIIAAFLNLQFGVSLLLVPIAGLVVLVGVAIWLGFNVKAGNSGRVIFRPVDADRVHERELIALLKTQADSDPEHRDHALRTIQEIESREVELQAMASLGRGQMPRTVLLRSKRFLVSLMIGSAALLALAHVLGKPKFAVGLLILGTFALWSAQHWYFTKQSIYRKGGPYIEFEKEPGAHTSAVLASCVLGAFFVFSGAYALLQH